MKQPAKRQAKPKARSKDAELKAALQWAVGPDTGLSSLVLCAVTMGVKPDEENDGFCPRDSGDLGRCIRFLRAVPEARRRLRRMAKVSRYWAVLVDRWAELEACYVDEEAAESANPGLHHGKPRTNALIDATLRRAERRRRYSARR